MKMKKQGRAANGTGTIRKRSDGRWEARYTAPDGKQRSVYAKDEKAVRTRLKAAQAELTLGIWFEPSKVTMEQWVRTWLANYTKHVKPTTLQSYERFANNHIIPRLGSIKLSRLRTVHIQQAFNDMSKTLSVGSMESVKICLSSCLSTAMRFGMLKENPCKGIKLGKKQPKEMVIIDRPDMQMFVLAAKQSPYYAAMMVLLQTGIRTGELRGLTWANVDLDNHAIYIRQQISDTKSGPIIQSTKGYLSRRIVIIEDTARILREHKKEQTEARLMAGGWKDTDLTRDLVFRMADGSAYPRTALNWPVGKTGRKIGIEGLHPHSLRDSYAVAALRSGVDVKTVQNNLGHKDATVTLNTYAKYTDDMGKVGAQKFADYWHENTLN